MKYLEKTACRNQNAEVIQGFLEAVKDFKLTKAEKLQLINLRPTTPVEMQLVRQCLNASKASNSTCDYKLLKVFECKFT